MNRCLVLLVVSVLAISMRWILGANRDNLKDKQEFVFQHENSVLLRRKSSFYLDGAIREEKRDTQTKGANKSFLTLQPTPEMIRLDDHVIQKDDENGDGSELKDTISISESTQKDDDFVGTVPTNVGIAINSTKPPLIPTASVQTIVSSTTRPTISSAIQVTQQVRNEGEEESSEQEVGGEDKGEEQEEQEEEEQEGDHDPVEDKEQGGEQNQEQDIKRDREQGEEDDVEGDHEQVEDKGSTPDNHMKQPRHSVRRNKFSSKHTPGNPKQPVVKTLVLPKQSEQAVAEQQRRFDTFLEEMKQRQISHQQENRVVIYKIHKESGLGNMIRGYLTALVVGMMTDRAVQVKTPRNFYFRFFFEPFPYLGLRSANPVYHNFTVWEYFPNKNNIAKLQSTPLEKWWKESAVVLTTYSDITSRFLRTDFYRDRLVEWGIIPDINGKMQHARQGSLFRAAILPLIVSPQPYLCEVVNKHIKILRQKKVIGIQMRLGGQKANYNEKLFLGPKSIAVFLEKVERCIRQKGWKREEVFVFVSTDSTYALNEVKKALDTPSYKMVYSVSEYMIGHSAVGKTLIYGDKQRDSFMNRAILDLLLLKESDFLLYSQGSSFGLIAYELQQAYRYPVNATAYLKKQGLTCSVFHHRDQVGEATYVSKYRKKGKKTSVLK